jgi:1-phosphofructokinase
MIYTITFSPSLDYYMDCGNPVTDGVTRADKVRYELGGKGLNVSRVLKIFDMKSTAIIFTGGFVGEEIIKLCAKEELPFINIDTSANSRINVKLPGLEINAPVQDLSEDEIETFSQILDTFKSGDMVIVSGRVPENLDIKKVFGGRSFQLICDVSGRALHDFMELNPAVIKPNAAELAEYFGKDEPFNSDEIIAHALKLSRDDDVGKEGPMFVVVSMDASGILLAVGQKVFAIFPHKGEVKNTVGAGDACLAGFLAGLLGHTSALAGLRYANAAGAAKAFSENLPTADLIQELFLKEDIEPFSIVKE